VKEIKEVNILSTNEPKKVTLADGMEYTIVPTTMQYVEDVEKTMTYGGETVRERNKTAPAKLRIDITWAVLKQSHPDIAREQVGKLVGFKELSHFMEWYIMILSLGGVYN
jgi:hypothetical protein